MIQPSTSPSSIVWSYWTDLVHLLICRPIRIFHDIYLSHLLETINSLLMESTLNTFIDQAHDHLLDLIESWINQIYSLLRNHLTKVFLWSDGPYLLDDFIGLVETKLLFSHHLIDLFCCLIDLHNILLAKLCCLLFSLVQLLPEYLLICCLLDLVLLELK